MADRDPIWDALKQRSKDKFKADRARFLARAVANDNGEWTKHTPYHWSRVLNGKQLQYWPSRKTWMWKGEVKRGLKAMYKLIERETKS